MRSVLHALIHLPFGIGLLRLLVWTHLNILRMVMKNPVVAVPDQRPFKTKRRNYEKLYNEEIEHLIIEGIFAFNISKYIFKNARIKIFIINKKEIFFKLRFRRDIKSRGRSASEIKKRFDKGWELFNKSNLKNDKNILRINSDEKFFQKSIEYILRKI